MTLGPAPGDPAGHTRIVSGGIEGYIALADLVDVGAETDRLKRALHEATDRLEQSRANLANPAFRDNAPEAVVAKEEAKAAEFESTIEKLQSQLAELDS